MIQRLVLRSGERRGYWRHYARKDYRHTIVPAMIDDHHVRVLMDSGAEVSILDSDFARKSGIYVDTSVQLNCSGVGGSVYPTEGKAKVKLTLGGELVYEFEMWVGRLTGMDALLGTDFMEPAGVRLDLVEGVACLPDEVRVRFEGRCALYSDRAEQVRVREETTLYPGRSVLFRVRGASRRRLWLRRDEKWIATARLNTRGEPTGVKVTNVADVPTTIASQTVVGVWLSPDAVPRQSRFVSVGSRKYREWTVLVYEAEPDDVLEERREREADLLEASLPPPVERKSYPTPKSILKRPGHSERPDTSGEHTGGVGWVEDLPAEKKDEEPKTIRYVRAAIAFVQAKSIAELVIDSGLLDDAAFVHEGGDVSAEELEGEMALIPEVTKGPAVEREDIQVGRGEGVTEEMVEQVRSIIWAKREYLMGRGNALPLPARGVVCDIDVGNARPVAQQCRKVPPKFVDRLYEVLKDLLQVGFIAPSTSQWASPIVIVLKKNGVDIRLCIDYRVVNSLTKLMVYPMPVVHDLLENLGALRWLCSLDMASGFWVVRMTARAREVSAFITPFGLFEWTRMPFGLKNAPQIYQRLLDNALYGYLKLTPKHLHEEEADVFVDGEPAGDETKPAIGRRSYIDDILFGGNTWSEMCEKLERLMDTCERWGLSISLPKSEFGMEKVDYLGHRVSADGIEAKPKNLDKLVQLEFPRTVKGIQSFLGSLNYYHRFIEHFGVYAAALYEVTPADLAQEAEQPGVLAAAKKAFEALKLKLADAPLLHHFDDTKQVNVTIYANGWAIAATLLQVHEGHLMPVRFFSRVLKPHKIRFSPAEHEVLALLHVLAGAAVHLAGREIHVLTRHSTLAWLFQAKGLQGRLEKWAAMLSPWSLVIRRAAKGEDELTGLLAAATGPCDRLDEMLHEIQPRKKHARDAPYRAPLPVLRGGEEAWAVSFDGSAKPKRAGASCSAVLWHLPSWKVKAAASWYWVDGTVNEAEYRGAIKAFELAASHGIGEIIVFGDSRIIIQQLRGEIECRTPTLQVLHAEALAVLAKFKRAHLVHVKRDFNAAADLITGTALQRTAGEVVEADRFADLETVNRLHEVFNKVETAEIAPAVMVTTRAQRRETEARGGARETPVRVQDDEEADQDARADTTTNQLPRDDESEGPESDPAHPLELQGGSRQGDHSSSVDRCIDGPVSAADDDVTTGRQQGETGNGDDVAPEPATPELVRLLRAERIRAAQVEESWARRLKLYLRNDVANLDEHHVRTCAKIAHLYEVVDDLLYYVGSKNARDGQGREPHLRLVVPRTLCVEVLHHYHTSLSGGHQGISRTYEKARRHLFWQGLYEDVRRYVQACPDCQSGKGEPRFSGSSPGNVVGTRPFQVIGMDHVPSLPRSHRGNSELLVWVDHHSGFIVVSANPSREAQTVAEAYERCVYRRFGASEVIRHDREPAFMSKVFKAFNRLIGQRSRATLAYRPQANGTTERMVQTVMRAVKLYVADPNQRDWDEYAERLVFAINTSFDRVRQEIPFYLVHGWEPRTTLEVGLPTGTDDGRHVNAKRWRVNAQAQYRRAREEANRLLQEAVDARRDRANQDARDEQIDIKAGDRVWLFINQVRPGYAKKLAHLWHGPFRVLERPADHLVKLEVDGTNYRFYPLVHVSRLKLWKAYVDRPSVELEVADDARFDFDEALLPEDSFTPDNEAGEYEVEAIVGHRDSLTARQGRSVREYQVRWVGYEDLDWVAEEDLNAPSLLAEYEQQLRSRGRFAVMETEDG